MHPSAHLATTRQRLLDFWHSDQGVRFADAFWMTSPSSFRGLAGTFAELESDRLTQAELFWVSADMSKMVMASAKMLPGFTLNPEDLMTPCGLVWFDDPLPLIDIHGTELKVCCMSWSIAYAAVAGSESLPSANEKMCPGVWISLYDHSEQFISYGIPDGVMFLGGSFIQFGSPWQADDHYGLPSENILYALMEIATSEYAAKESVSLPRPMLRRAQRAGTSIKPIVTVDIRKVRRKRSEIGEEGDEVVEVPWSHRWMVGWPHGFWRRQWYPSLGTHKPKWIAPYVKGPADKDLIVKDKMNRVWR
jgi:hypothetical protein